MPAGHRSADRGAVIGVVDRGDGVVGAEVGDVVPERGQLGPQDLLQVEPGVIRADGDAHGHRVYRRPREPPGRFGGPGTLLAAMALDPRTPVVVGVGQVSTPADAGLAAADRPEPLELMTAALRAAAEDCDGAAAGRLGPGRAPRCCAGPTASASWHRSGGTPSTRPWRWRRALGFAGGFGAGPADGLGHRRQLPAGAHARRLPRHQPGRPRRGPGDRRRGHVRPRPGAGATRPSRGSNGRPSRPRPRRPRCSAWTSRARPSSR